MRRSDSRGHGWRSGVRAGIAALGIAAVGGAQDRAPRVEQERHLERIRTYVDFTAGFVSYAETLWHDDGVGGYWGDGGSGGNGGVRGSANLTLAYALLAYGWDRGWLDEAARAEVRLGRDDLVARAEASWTYLARGHLTGEGTCADGKQWGRSWQSSLWIGAAGLAALLVWDDLDEAARAAARRVVVDEADHRAAQAPRDAKPGNTAAEENGWDTHALAVALALFPDHDHAERWLRAAQLFAVNTLSVAADRSSSSTIGTDRVADVVTTANLHPDFTLDNHGFFHPSYLRVSGQELGEALAMLRLGDRRHGSNWVERFRPYAMHHVADAWKVLEGLLLPEGETAYPAGSDWALHVPSIHSYLAFIATELGEPAAVLAERRAFTAADWRRRVSPPGRILGATNFEWWWEPLVLKRFATAALHWHLCERPVEAPDPELLHAERTWYSPHVGVWLHRNARYFAIVSLRGVPTLFFDPLGPNHLEHPYSTTPVEGAWLPPGKVVRHARFAHELGEALVLRYADGGTAAVVAMQQSVLVVSDAEPGAAGIENDAVVSPSGRELLWGTGRATVAPMSGEAWDIPPPFLSIDGGRVLAISWAGFRWESADSLTRRSAAEDLLRVRGAHDRHAVQLWADGDVKQVEALVVRGEGDRWIVEGRDGGDGRRVRVALTIKARVVPVTGLSFAGTTSERHPLAHAADGDPSTFAVLALDGRGPGADAPIVLGFELPERPAIKLRLTPRPGYGPRRVVLEQYRGGEWISDGAPIRLANEAIDLPFGPHEGVRSIRLVVTAGWDRGRADDAPRNTQIAELAWVGLVPGPEGGAPFELEVR